MNNAYYDCLRSLEAQMSQFCNNIAQSNSLYNQCFNNWSNQSCCNFQQKYNDDDPNIIDVEGRIIEEE